MRISDMNLQKKIKKSKNDIRMLIESISLNAENAG